MQGLREQSEEAIFFIDIPNFRGLVLSETRPLYLHTSVSREQLTLPIGHFGHVNIRLYFDGTGSPKSLMGQSYENS